MVTDHLASQAGWLVFGVQATTRAYNSKIEIGSKWHCRFRPDYGQKQSDSDGDGRMSFGYEEIPAAADGARKYLTALKPFKLFFVDF